MANITKTRKEWFEELPQDVKEKALANITSPCRLQLKSVSLKVSLSMAFTWGKTPEGHAYWSNISDSLYNMKILLTSCTSCGRKYAYAPYAAKCCRSKEPKPKSLTALTAEDKRARKNLYLKQYYADKKKKAQEVKALKFPIASPSQLQEIETIEFEKGIIFKGTSKVEASKFIKENT